MIRPTEETVKNYNNGRPWLFLYFLLLIGCETMTSSHFQNWHFSVFIAFFERAPTVRLCDDGDSFSRLFWAFVEGFTGVHGERQENILNSSQNHLTVKALLLFPNKSWGLSRECQQNANKWWTPKILLACDAGPMESFQRREVRTQSAQWETTAAQKISIQFKEIGLDESAASSNQTAPV